MLSDSDFPAELSDAALTWRDMAIRIRRCEAILNELLVVGRYRPEVQHLIADIRDYFMKKETYKLHETPITVDDSLPVIKRKLVWAISERWNPDNPGPAFDESQLLVALATATLSLITYLEEQEGEP